ncbi:MAG: archaetidylserine decarboxylase [Parachlamydiales bacterium]|jgi:phosphatidylserine decarboxylase
MPEKQIFDLRKKVFFTEKVYGQSFLAFFCQNNLPAKFLRWLFGRFAFFSQLLGLWQKSFFSKKQIWPFLKKYQIDSSEFVKKPEEFTSFNDFFVRRLKPEKRPISSEALILPADARYLVFENLAQTGPFWLKGRRFDLKSLLQDGPLAEEYREGALAIARLAPVDYHRFHFPCQARAKPARLIRGSFYSVNPQALRLKPETLWENKRCLIELETELFGRVLAVAIGAALVSSIQTTYEPGIVYPKGAEMGYFAFGGSTLVLLFLKNKVLFKDELQQLSARGIESYALMGGGLGITCRRRT